MSIQFIEEYAGALTKEDIIDLFEILRKSFSIAEAARIVDLERKTIYDWDEVDYIKLETKKKVLNAIIGTQPEKTLEFMLKRFEENTADILYIYFSLLYNKAIVEECDKEEFIEIFERFNTIKRKHSGLIHKRLGEEVGDISQIFREKAIHLGISISPPSINEMRPADIIEIIPDAMRELLLEKYSEKTNFSIATEFNLPIELVDVVFMLSSELELLAEHRYAQELRLPLTSSEGFEYERRSEPLKNEWILLPSDLYSQPPVSAAQFSVGGQ